MSKKSKNQNNLLRSITNSENQEVIRERLSEAGKVVVATPDWVPKISGVFIEFMEPWQEPLSDPEQGEFYLALGVMAWNTSLLPKKHHKKAIHIFTDMMKADIEDFEPEMNQDLKLMRQTISALIKRKLQYFADDRRFITDSRLSNDGDEVSVAIAATLPT